MADNPIKYSEFIQPDGSITDLIKQLEQVQTTYAKMRDEIVSAAKELEAAMKKVNNTGADGQETTKRGATEAELLAKAYDDLTRAESDNAKKLADLKRQQKEQNDINKLTAKLNASAEGSYNRLSAQYSLNKIKLNQMSAAQRNLTAEGKKLEAETKAIYLEMDRLQRATGKNQLNVGNYRELATTMSVLPGALGSASVQVGRLGSAFSLLLNNPVVRAIALIAGFVAGIGYAIKNAMTFAYEMSKVKAVTGATSEEFDQLKQNAKDVGAATVKTATEVAQLEVELGKLGFTVKEILETTSSVVAISTATGASLARSAEVVGGTLRGFGLDAKYAGLVADTMAKAFMTSALDMEKWAESVKYIAPVAKTAGVSLAEASAMLAILSNSMIDGSMAGTSLRTIMLKLGDQSGSLTEKIKKLSEEGLSLADANDEVGKRAMTALLVLSKQVDLLPELTQKYTDVQGSVEKMAEIMRDNLSGDITLAKSAWDSLMLSFDDGEGIFSRVARFFVQAWTDLLRAFTYANSKIGSGLDWVYDKYMYVSFAVNAYVTQIGKAFTTMGSVIIKVITGDIAGAKDELIKFKDGVKEAFDTKLWDAALDKAKKVKELEKSLRSVNKQMSPEEIQAENDRLTFINKYIKTKKELLKSEYDDNLAELQKGLNNEWITVKQYNEAKLRATEDYNNKLAKLNKEKKPKGPSATDITGYNNKLLAQNNKERAKLTEEGASKEKAILLASYNKEKADLINYMNSKKKYLSPEAVKAGNDTLLALKENYLSESQKIDDKYALIELETQNKSIELKLQSVKKGSDKENELKIQLLENQRKQELLSNSKLTKSVRQNEQDINAKYDNLILKQSDDFLYDKSLLEFDNQQALAASEFDLLRSTEAEKTKFRLEQEKARWQKILELNKIASNKLSDVEINTIKNTIAKIDKEITSPKNQDYDIYSVLGLKLDDDQKEAISTSTSFVLEQISSILQAKVEAAQEAVDSANTEVEAAQKKLDGEIEARQNGYASDVSMAQKELNLAKKNQEKALKEQEKAQKAQAAIQTIEQIGDLVTASAKIWGQLGFPLAIPAIAVMWGSFAAAKIKAAQVTKKKAYGEGGLEFLEGGSHASGKDIQIGKTKDGKDRRAEGGEALAIIRRSSTRKYRKLLPSVITSLNKGTFEEKYLKSYDTKGLGINLSSNITDLSALENDVQEIKKQGERRYYTDGKGRVIETYKNLRRTYK